MKKFTRIIAALALLAFMIPTMAGWGQTVTFVAGTDTGDGSVTKDGITVAMSTMNRTDNYRCNANTDMTITSTVGNITSVVLTSTANGTSTYGPGKFSVPTNGAGTYTYESNGKTGTWTGDASPVVLHASAQVRMTQIVVTYTSGGGSSTTTTITAPQDFNNDIQVGTTAGTLTAAVTETASGNAVSGATVTWASTDESVATVDQTGAVTLVANGTTNITATYEGDQSHAGSVGTYELTVINSANVTYDFTSVSNFWINNTYTTHPTAGTSASHTDLRTFYYDNETHDEFTGTGTIFFQTSYLMMNSGSTLTLPTYQGYKITQIIITNTSACSTSVEVGILSGENNAAPAQTWGTQSGSYTYNISSDYQTEALTVKVTNSKNAQVAGITVVREEINSNKVATPTFEPAGGVITESTNVTISCDTDEAIIYYTTDGSTPTTSSAVYSQPITVNSTMTLKAIAVKSGMTDSNVGEATFTRKYFVNLTQTTGGTISVNPAQAEVGQTVTLTASSNVGYTFGSWTVTPSVTLSGNTFTMPASDVTVTATFTASTNSHTVSFSVNGKVEMTATVFGGGSIDLTKFVAEGDGYTFEGWSTTAGGENIATQNAYTPSSDITLYPGVNPTPASDAYTLVTNDSQLEEGNLVVITANGTKNVAMSTTQNNNNRGTATITKNNNNTITIPEDITGAVVCELTLGVSNNHWTFYDATNNGYLYAVSGNNYLRTQTTNNADGEWTISISNNEATITAQGENTSNRVLKYNSGNDIFSCYTTGQQTVCLYTKPVSKSARGNRAVPTISKVMAIPANVIVTVKANGIVYLTGNNSGNEANLIVEDGGQLVASNNVKGTMQKTINSYTSDSNGWYFISSPLTSNVSVTDVENLTNGSYDLYYFKQDPNESDGSYLEWINQKSNSNFTSLFAGSGYLYANAAETTLGFAGNLRKSSEATFDKSISYANTNPDEDMRGWNLVGNPFPSNAQVNMAFYKMNNTNDGINPTAVAANSIIAPTEGVFVRATEDVSDQKVTFTATTDPVTSNSKSRNINIDVTRQGEFLDRAIVSFNAESSLSKLVLNENTTKLYFSQDQKDYAIIASANENEMPVNFKASRNGSYTISINTNEVEMNYLHLIDNLTGADVDLMATPSYTFNARTDDYASRFRLVFSTGNADSDSFAFVSDGQIILTEQGDAQVYDVMGRMISSHNNVNHITTEGMAAGVYVLQLVNGSNVKTQKIVVK